VSHRVTLHAVLLSQVQVRIWSLSMLSYSHRYTFASGHSPCCLTLTGTHSNLVTLHAVLLSQVHIRIWSLSMLSYSHRYRFASGHSPRSLTLTGTGSHLVTLHALLLPQVHIRIWSLSMLSYSHRYTFASGSPDNIKQWKFPDGNFIKNLSGHNAIVNALTVNHENVLVSGGK